VKQVRIQRRRARGERPWDEVLSPGLRDPDVVRAKALARTRSSRQRAGSLAGSGR